MQYSFIAKLLLRAGSNWFKIHPNNVDHLRFSSVREISSLREHLLERFRAIKSCLRLALGAKELGWVYSKLKNEYSRELLLDLLAYRALGYIRVKFPLNKDAYWRAVKSIDQDLQTKTVTGEFRALGPLHEYDLAPCDFPIRIQAHPLNILNTFLLQQYRLTSAPNIIEAEAGDVVIDAGACWGDTALYFAHKVGPDGAVYAYEFEPSNLQCFRKNMAMNADLANIVHLQEYAVWSKASEVLEFSALGSASRLVSPNDPIDGNTTSVNTDTIDQLVVRESIKKVNYIKMDIEGAELDALRGAEQTIRKFTPKLAISIYHNNQHYWQIAQYIDSLNLGYEFYIDHYTIHLEEVMLFAQVSGTNRILLAH